jgi:purine nucleosidase
LLDSGVPHVYLPGFHVGAQLRLSLPEMQAWVRGRGALGDYLHHLFMHNPLRPFSSSPQAGDPASPGFSWVIWDLVCVAWLLNADWLPSAIVSTPRLGADLCWQHDATRHPMREAYAVQRDPIFRDMLSKLAQQG